MTEFRRWTEHTAVTQRPETTLAEVRERFPGWSIHRSDIGRWWAQRGGTASPKQQETGARAQVDADDLDKLWDLLAEQERLWGRA